MKGKRRVLALILVPVLSLGCASSLSRLEGRLGALEMKVGEMSASVRVERERLEGMERRILLLQDEIETMKMALSRGIQGQGKITPPQDLPTVRIEPKEESAVEFSPSEVSDDSVYQEIDEEGRVVSRASGRKEGEKRPAPQGDKGGRRSSKGDRPSDDEVLAEYQAALDLYKQGRMEEAKEAFVAFATKYPRHPYADNALYWAGECLYDLKDYVGARAHFMRVVEEHPDGNKVPDAMVKIGLCDRALGRPQDALRMFRTVILSYPDSEAARVAARLQEETR